MTTTQRLPARHVAPLSLAGFTTAFGAHGVGSVLGAETDDIGLSLLGLGIVLALYDVAEVVLKPVFGALSDRVGAKPVIVAGLLGFALASLLALVVPSITVLAVARVGQGAAAAAFSPASSAAVARLAGTQRLGRYFGRYGAWKGLGYVLGPLLGILLVETLDIRALYLALAVLAVVAAAWVVVSVPALAPQPRPRYTLVDLVRQTTDRSFLVPTVVLASTTAVLGVAVGFLPLLATRLDLPAPVGAAAIVVLALVSTVVQPRTGRLRDAGRITTRTGSAAALAGATAVLVVVAVAPNAVTLFLTAVVFGAVVGVVTPLAFAHLAAATPEERMGRTMGNAELGREVGDAGGPLLVGAVAAAWTLPAALGVLAATTAGAAVVGWVGLRERERRRG
ncbi:MFS transporter [Curtobacterium sp. B8]|uniref:MFS transporter n=1 Tax=Curtobacterium sp. B8 TaxID=95611 RepID=UPI00034737F8|nr:MFS transporter [Curtobacterium sp. B8]